MQMTGKPAFAMFNGGHPSATASYAEPEEVVAAIGLKIAHSGSRIARLTTRV